MAKAHSILSVAFWGNVFVYKISSKLDGLAYLNYRF